MRPDRFSDVFRVERREEPVLLRLVAESVRGATFVLDGMVFADRDAFGEPVALVLSRTDSAWFDVAVDHLLKGWATNSDAVLLRVKNGRRGSVLVLEHRAGPTRVCLDLIAVA